MEWKPKLLTITPAVRDRLVMLCLAVDRERYGLLMGEFTKRGFNVTEVLEVPNVKSKQFQVDVNILEEDRAQEVAEWVLELERVGTWHSHCWKICCSGSLLPQINEEDYETMDVDGVELICSTFREPEGGLPEHPDEFSVTVQVADLICKIEAWVRGPEEAQPCEIRVL